MVSFLLQSLFSIVPPHLICSSRAFAIFKAKKRETCCSLGRMRVEFSFLDFENPNPIIVITVPSEIPALTSIFFLIILSQIDGELHMYSWKWNSGQLTTLYFGCACGHYRLPQAAGDPSGRVQQWPDSRSVRCGLTADPFGGRPQSRGRYYPESNVIIGIPLRLSQPFTPQEVSLVPGLTEQPSSL